VQVVDFMKQMVDGTIAARGVDYPAGLATFTSGRAGMILTGEWELPGYIEAGVPLGAAPFPTLFGTPSAFADSHAFVLPHQDTPDEDRRRSAHEAVATILKESLTWAEAGHVPSYGPVAESPEYAALTPQSDYVAAAEVAKVDPAAWFTGAGSDFQAQVSSVLNAACAGGPSAEEAVDEVVRRIEVIMAKPNPVGEPV
jgi:multiple sugar transport system substrate-binding protein